MSRMEVKHLTKGFNQGAAPVVDGIDFSLEPGEIFGLLGPSGCGKTTTLRIISGFERPDGGDILINGFRITGLPPEKRKIGFVFQDYALFPHLTVEKNIAFGIRKKSPKAAASRVDELLSCVGLPSFGKRMPQELSGGEQQRVALARALAADPEIILMDEPFSSLDASRRDRTRREVRNLLKCAGVTTVLVTHDQEEALSFCDRVGVMNRGRIEQIGTPEEIYLKPESPFVATFIGRSNLLQGEASGLTADTELGRIPLSTQAEGKVMISLRPEHLSLVPANGTSLSPDDESSPALSGTNNAAVITSKEFRGHNLTYHLQSGERSFIVHTEYTESFEIGERVRIIPRAAAVVLRESGEPVCEDLSA